MSNSVFGEYIKSARSTATLTLKELSESSGISISQLSKIERGESHPSRDSVEKLSYALNTSIDELLILAGYANENPMEIIDRIMEEIAATKSSESAATSETIKEVDNKIHYFNTNFRISKDDEYSDSLKDVVFEWFIRNERALTRNQIETLSSEIEDFYKVRRKSYLLNRP